MLNFKGLTPFAKVGAALGAFIFLSNEGSYAGAMLGSALSTPALYQVFAPRTPAMRRFVIATVIITLMISAIGAIGLYLFGVNAFTKASAPYTMPMMLGSIVLMVVLIKWLFPPDGERNPPKKAESTPARRQQTLRVVK